MNPKHKAHRKTLREVELKAQRKKNQTIDKWLNEWLESQRMMKPDYPVKKSKRLTKEQFRKLLQSR